MSENAKNIDALSTQTRRDPPADAFAAKANATAEIYDGGLEEFWDAEATQRLDWSTPSAGVVSMTSSPRARWRAR